MHAKAKPRSQPITKSRIERALASSNATSLAALYKAMGGKGSIPGSTSKRIKALVPDITDRLAQNKTTAVKATKQSTPRKKTAPKKSVSKKAGGKKTYKRHAKNPFREGSGYGLVFDILAAHPKGIRRDQLVEAYSKASGKPLKTAGYDCAVVLSAKDSVTGPRHRSCRNGFFCIKENLFCRLMLS